MKLTLLEVPYDSGHYAARLGRGPLHLVEAGLADRLAAGGHDVELVRIRLPEGFRSAAAEAAALQRLIRRGVLEATAAGRLAITLAGNCTPAALGSTTAFAPGTTGVLWFDAHGDFNTPETSASGFFDGMGLAVVTGSCFAGLAASMEGFQPTPEANVLLIGARDLDAGEVRRLAGSEVRHLPVAEIRADAEALPRALSGIAGRVERFYLHLDLDVLDPAALCANEFASPSGLSLEELEAAITAAGTRRPLGAIALTAYDPSADTEAKGLEVALRLIETAAGARPRAA
jgi:arginase